MELIHARPVVQSKTACRVIGMAAFVILMVLSAFVRIPVPFSPVPVTLQTLVVLLGGACLAGGFGVGAQAGYLGLGLAGLPVFSGAGSGLLYLAGPTGGYIAGFVLANALLGRLFRGRTENLYAIAGKFLLADAVIFACGIAWLKVLLGCTVVQAVSIGLVPFLAGDIAKIIAASFIYLKIQTRVKQIFA